MDGQHLNRTRSIITLVLSITFLVNVFLQSPLLDNINLVLSVVVIALSFPVVTGTSKIIGFMTFLVSIILLWHAQAPLSVWREALKDNLFLVVMFGMVPLLGIPIQHGGYTKALRGVFERHVNSNSRFYLLVSFISAFVGVLVSLAVVPLVYEICRASSRSEDSRLLSTAISRGFTTCLIWAPTTAAIGLIVQLTGAEWHEFFPFGIAFGVIAGVVGYGMTLFEQKDEQQAPDRFGGHGSSFNSEVPEEKIDTAKIAELSFFGIILIAGIAVISYFSGISAIIIVSLASLVYPVLWLSIIKRLPVLVKEFKGDYFHHKLPGLKNEIVLFMGAGLLAASINYSHLGDYVPQVMTFLVGHNAFLLTIVVISLSVLISALGVHPIVTVTILGGTIQAAAYGVSPTYLALVLSTSWAMGTSVSPSSANIIAVSGIVGQSPLQVGLRWNSPYVAVSSIVLILALTVLRWIGLL